MPTSKSKVFGYLKKDLFDQVHRLAKIRDWSVSTLIGTALRKEVDAAVKSGELPQKETPADEG